MVLCAFELFAYAQGTFDRYNIVFNVILIAVLLCAFELFAYAQGAFERYNIVFNVILIAVLLLC